MYTFLFLYNFVVLVPRSQFYQNLSIMFNVISSIFKNYNITITTETLNNVTDRTRGLLQA